MFSVQLKTPDIVRVFSQIRITDTGCWEWQGYRNSDGYGGTYYNRKRVHAHRLVFAWAMGPIPTGYSMNLDHLCRNRACVNPIHLELVTWKENLLRGKSLDNLTSTQHAMKTHCPKGHAYTGENLYIIPSTGGRLCRTCRREHYLRSRSRT